MTAKFPIGEPFNPWHGACGFYPADIVSKLKTITDPEGKVWLLKDGPKRVYERLVRFAGRDGLCWPSQIKVGSELGKVDRRVRSCIHTLKAVGLIRSKVHGLGRGEGVRTVYEFLYHPVFEGGSYNRTVRPDVNPVTTGHFVPLQPDTSYRYNRTLRTPNESEKTPQLAETIEVIQASEAPNSSVNSSESNSSSSSSACSSSGATENPTTTTKFSPSQEPPEKASQEDENQEPEETGKLSLRSWRKWLKSVRYPYDNGELPDPPFAQELLSMFSSAESREAYQWNLNNHRTAPTFRADGYGFFGSDIARWEKAWPEARAEIEAQQAADVAEDEVAALVREKEKSERARRKAERCSRCGESGVVYTDNHFIAHRQWCPEPDCVHRARKEAADPEYVTQGNRDADEYDREETARMAGYCRPAVREPIRDAADFDRRRAEELPARDGSDDGF